MVAAFVSTMDSITNLPVESITATEIVACAPFVGVDVNNHNLTPKGRPFIMRLRQLLIGIPPGQLAIATAMFFFPPI
jgi:hypothetical protein